MMEMTITMMRCAYTLVALTVAAWCLRCALFVVYISGGHALLLDR